MKSKNIAIALSLAITTLIMASPFQVGDFLYLGYWYYFASPSILIGCAVCFLPKPNFVLGSLSGLAISLIPFWVFQTTSLRPEGLIGLVHIFSFPVMLAGMWFASWAMLKINTNTSLAAFVAGTVGALGGELLGEFVLCTQRLACGPITFWLFTFK